MAALAYQATLGAVVLTPFALVAGLQDVSVFLGAFAAGGVLHSPPHGVSIAAFRLAPAGILAPLVCLEIVVAIFVGFGDWPQFYAWVGNAIILAAGALVAIKRN